MQCEQGWQGLASRDGTHHCITAGSDQVVGDWRKMDGALPQLCPDTDIIIQRIPDLVGLG